MRQNAPRRRPRAGRPAPRGALACLSAALVLTAGACTGGPSSAGRGPSEVPASAPTLDEARTCAQDEVAYWSARLTRGSVVVCGTEAGPVAMTAALKDLDVPTLTRFDLREAGSLLCATSGDAQDPAVCLDFDGKVVRVVREGTDTDDLRPWSTLAEDPLARDWLADRRAEATSSAAPTDGAGEATASPTPSTTTGSTPTGSGGTSGAGGSDGPTSAEGTPGSGGTAGSGGSGGGSSGSDGDAPAASVDGPRVPADAAADLVLGVDRIAEEVAGYVDRPTAVSSDWAAYYRDWTFDPAGCAGLETVVAAAPEGFAMAYGTGTGGAQFVKQQVVVLSDGAAARAAYTAFAEAARACPHVVRGQGNGRSYEIEVTGVADESHEYPGLSVQVSAEGPTSWTSQILLQRLGNALIWTNSGTYTSATNTVDGFGLMVAQTSHLREWSRAHAG